MNNENIPPWDEKSPMELRTSFKYYMVPKLSQRWCNMVALKRALWAVTGFGIISASNEVECCLIHSYFSLVQCVFKEFLCLICKALTTWKFCRFPKEDERYQEGKRYIYWFNPQYLFNMVLSGRFIAGFCKWDKSATHCLPDY